MALKRSRRIPRTRVSPSHPRNTSPFFSMRSQYPQLPGSGHPARGLFIDRWGTLLELPEQGFVSRFEGTRRSARDRRGGRHASNYARRQCSRLLLHNSHRIQSCANDTNHDVWAQLIKHTCTYAYMRVPAHLPTLFPYMHHMHLQIHVRKLAQQTKYLNQ